MSSRVNLANLNDPKTPLHECPVEDIVAEFSGDEMSRKDKDDNYQERSVAVTYRATINGLETSIAQMCEDDACGVGILVFERCCARQYASWYASLPVLKEIPKLYKSLLKQSADLGMPDIGSWINRTETFRFVNGVPAGAPQGASSFSSVGKFKAAVHGYAVCTGIDEYKLVSIGLAWCISTNAKQLSSGNIRNFFKPEIKHLLDHLQERIMYLEYCQNVLDMRITQK